MTPEAQEHLGKAQGHLAKARAFLEVNHYPDEAGRAAYLAAFHGAQALISERTGRIARTHAGVHSQFNLLTKNAPQVDDQLRRFLSDAFDFKSVADYEVGPNAVADYEVGPNAVVSSDEAATATRFIDRITEILASAS